MASDREARVDPGAALALVGIAAFVGFLFVLPEPRVAAAPTERLPSGAFAVVDALVFDGETFQPHTDVWVEAGRVKTVGRKLDLPEDLPRVDGRAHTLLPGLIDAHVHTFGTSRSDALRFGVTTLLDQFTEPSLGRPARRDRETIEATTEADLYTAGYLATVPGGHGTEYGLAVPTLTKPEQAADWVRARVAEGSDWIKIVYDEGTVFGAHFPTLDAATTRALIDAAHAEQLMAVVHVSSLEDALDVRDMGADGLVHVWSDELITAQEARGFADADVFVTPTLVVEMSFAGDQGHLALLEGSAAKSLSSAQRQSLTSIARVGPNASLRPEAFRESVRRLHEAGVRLLAGTDAPNPGTAFGISLHREIGLLHAAGLDAAAALAAATSVAADAYGLADRGRIRTGSLADLVLVEGDVQENLDNTSNRAAVWKDGSPVTLELAGHKAAAAAPGTTEPILLGNFDEGERPGWSASTDSMMGGTSSAELAVEGGALVVRGEVRPGFAYPWSGAAVGFPSERVDLSSLEGLRFRARGDGRTYRAMLITTGGAPGPPPTVSFDAGASWREIVIPLEDFRGADLSRVQAFAFVTGTATGTYEFLLDDVGLR